ncbi:hypothetical protein Golomagni_04799 [Golovinomyces magnicellulatus]|nr:hypothetical protein Golomagni_04799 [Golovinomyces magnicellulatus]
MEVNSAAAVCEGSQDSRNLFHGMKFFVVQRISSIKRSEIVQMIQTNGGVIVLHETQADILIADHEREEIPPGSISWTFIVESIRKGSCQELEQHRTGLAKGKSRHINRQTGVKPREAFSAADDQILLEFCLNAEKEGLNLKGNVIYMQLEQKNNRHTYQSWRNRWIRHVSKSKPIKHIEATNHSDQTHKVINGEQKINDIGSCNTSGSREIKPASHSKMEPTKCTNFKFTSNNEDWSNSTKSNLFTTEDIDLLILVHPDIVKVDDDHEIDAWNTWAHEYPQHTAQQWRNYYKYHVKPQQEALASIKPKPTPPEKNLHKIGAVAEQNVTRSSISSPLSYKEHQETFQASSRSKQITRYQKFGETNEFSNDTVSISEGHLLAYDQMLHNEELFTQGLQALANELDLEVDFNPDICGRKISLMRLWQTVQSSKYSGFDDISEDRFWPKIASEFGFDKSAATELKDCYSEILSDFGNLRREFLMEGLPNESQENDSIENQLPSDLICVKNDNLTKSEDSMSFDSQIIHHDSDDLDVPLIQEEYQVSSRESSLESNQSRRRFIPNKRQRIRNCKKVLEIPSTPENKINGYQDPDLAQKRSPRFDVISDETDELDQTNQTPSNRRHSTRKSKLMRKSYSVNKEFKNGSLSAVEMDPKQNLNARVKTKTMVEDEDLLRHQDNSTKDNEPSEFSSNVVKFKNSTDLVDEIFTTQDNSNFEIKGDEHLFNQGLKDSYFGQNSDPLCPEQSEKAIVRQCHDASCYMTKQIRTEVNTEGADEIGIENELDTFIREQVFNSHISKDIVIEALEATSLSIGPKSCIKQVMDSLMNNEGIPDHLPGVWTATDDEILKRAFNQSSEVRIDSTVYQDLVKKHGISNIKLRQMYWRDMEDDMED